MPKLIGVNEKGCRVGEDHPRAKFSNGDIDLMFALQGSGWGYGRIARKMDCSKSHVRKILTGAQRAQTATRFKVR